MVRFRAHEVHDTDGTSVLGIDSSDASFLAPAPLADLQDRINSQKDAQDAKPNHVESTGQSRKVPEAGSSAPDLAEKKVELDDPVQPKNGSITEQATTGKKKLDTEGVEQQQAGSFTKVNGYLPRFHWHTAQQQAKSQRRMYANCLNLRDVGANMPALMKPGIVFRSSELLSAEDMRRYGISTILDLRRMDRPCKKKGKKIDKLRTAVRFARKGPKRLLSERVKPYAARGQPHACSICRERIKEKIGFEANSVVHADLIPTLVGLRLFQAMPASVKGQAILAALTGKGAASVMAPAVANPLYMGYKALYKTVLESSKRGIAKAMRVFADKDNYPVLLHCIHGKDRTGIIVMLLLMLCGVESSIIVDDYMKSESVLKASRMHDELDFDVYLTSDAVIAATKETMEDTIAYIDEKYEGAAKYLHEAGLEDWELSKIRVNLLQKADASDLLERLSMLQPLSSRHQSNERGKLQGLFTRSSIQRGALQRTRSQPDSDSLPASIKAQQGGPNAEAGEAPRALKGTVSAPPMSEKEQAILRASLKTANGTANGTAAGSMSDLPAVAEAPRKGDGASDGKVLSSKESDGMASAWTQLIDATTPRDFDTGKIHKGPEAPAATDPNKSPAIPGPANGAAPHRSIGCADVPPEPAEPVEPGQAPEHSLAAAYKDGAVKPASPESHDSHSETALLSSSKSLSKSGRAFAEDWCAPRNDGPEAAHDALEAAQGQANGASEPAGDAKASREGEAHPGVTAREV